MRTATKPHAQPMAPDAALPPVVNAAPTIVPGISRSTTTTVTTHTAVIETTVITWRIDPWVQAKDVFNAPKGPTLTKWKMPCSSTFSGINPLFYTPVSSKPLPIWIGY